MDASIVSHYGIHWDADNTAWLMQGRGSTNALGIKQKPPFKVKLPGKAVHCNHQVPLAAPVPDDYHWQYFLQILQDPLAQATLPVPKSGRGGTFYPPDPDDHLWQVLTLLSKLSSPIYNAVVPLWTLDKEAILRELQQTNVQPFVVTQCEAKHSKFLAEISKAAVYLPRKFIASGARDVVVPPSMKRIETRLGDPGLFDMSDMISLPWENLGATVIRKYMRREWPILKGSDDDDSQSEGPRTGNRTRQTASTPGSDPGSGVLHTK